MYSYDFVFYKPGKEFYTQQEILRLNNYLIRRDFEVEGKWRGKEKIEHLHLNIEKSNCRLSLHLVPGQEKIHGRIGNISIPQEQFKEDPEKSGRIMSEAAATIFAAIEPFFAWGDHELELGKLEPFLRFDRIGALAWTNLFSRELVERLGGVRNVLISPTPEDEKEGNRLLKEATFLPQALSHLPTEPTEFHTALECERRWPRALLRSFEIPPLKGIERVG